MAKADASAALDESFAEFWKAYPRKEKKPDGRRAYDSAIKKKRFSHHQIMAGLAKHMAAWRAMGTEQQYIPHPASWLNAERFNDEPTRFGQTALSAVPDLPTSFEEIRDNVDIRTANGLLPASFVSPSQPPSDPTPPEQWTREHGRRFIVEHEAQIRSALAKRQAV